MLNRRRWIATAKLSILRRQTYEHLYGEERKVAFRDSGARVANYDWRLKAEMDFTHCTICHHFLIA
jgi:hypothetical protein